MPLAALEAMDAGLPVVATDVIGTAEVVADRHTGLLVPPCDSQPLTAAIARLLSDARLREQYGAAGRRRYLKDFTAHRMATETFAVYQDALQAAGGHAAALPARMMRR
jgi:glycosyltransferase involved in cell wall biosynthesis